MPPPAETFASRLFLGPALRTQPDRRLVTLVREGYESAFEEIVRRYGKPLTRYAAAIVGSRGEDVTQEAFSKALLALRRDGNEIELRPWLFRIVRNTALNDLRDSPPTPELLAGAIAAGGNPAEVLERREELKDLMQRLQSLPEPQRAAIVMREMEGLSHEEIAAALGVSGGAARQSIHRARQALRGAAGALVPLPLLKALLVGSAMGTGEVAAGAAGVGGAAGAGVAIKAAAATVLVAGAVGAGVAIHDGRQGGRAQAPVASKSAALDRAATESAFTTPAETDPSGSKGGGGGDRHGSEPGDDRDGHGAERGDDRGGHSGPSSGGRGESGEDLGDDHGGGGESGGGHGGSPGPDDDRGDHGGSSGHGESSGHGGGPGSSGGGEDHGGTPQDESPDHGGSSGGSSGGSGSGGSDDFASGGGSGSSGGSDPSEGSATPTGDSSGSGLSEGSDLSGSGSESEPDDGSGGGGGSHGGA